MNHIQSKVPSEFNTENYVLADIFEPDLDDVLPTTLKEWGVPIPYPVLLSVNYDLNPRDYLEELLDGMGDMDNTAHVDFRVPGVADTTEIGYLLSEIFSEEFQPLQAVGKADPDESVLKTTGEGLLVHPFKLAVFLSNYAEDMEQYFDIRDALNEIIDKLFLTASLKFIFSSLSTNESLANGQQVLDAVKAALRDKRDGILGDHEFFAAEDYILIKDPQRAALFQRGGNYGGLNQLFVTIEDLETIVRDALAEKYDDLQNQYADLMEKIETYSDEVVMRRVKRRISIFGFWKMHYTIKKVPIDTSNHKWLFAAIREVSNSFTDGFSLSTLSFDFEGKLPPPTVTDEIDLRPQRWAKKAFELAGRKFFYEEKTSYLKGLISNNKDGFPDVREAYFEDWEEYGDVLAQIDELKDEVAEYGYEINLTNPDDTDKNTLGLFRSKTHSYQQVITTYRWVTRNHRKRRWFRTIRWTTRHRVPVRKTVTKTVTKDIPIKLDWDPISSYLDSKLDASTYTVLGRDGKPEDEATAAYRTSLLESINESSGTSHADIGAARNRDKDYRIFDMTGDQLLDQFGNDLIAVMKEADKTEQRKLLLLILPLMERDVSGNPRVIAYKAIHNPVSNRNSADLPSVAIYEDIETQIAEVNAYHRGPLAHTETLLPGEKRTFQITTELSQKQTVTSSREQKSSAASKSSSSVQQQVRREVNDISRRSQKNTWSVSASGSGSYGLAKVSASASASGSQSKFSENTMNRLNDRLTNSLNEISQKNELVISTSTERTRDSRHLEEKQIEIENFNTGRSITHFFYQILRSFRNRSRIRSIRVMLTYDDEFVSGYGYRRSELVPLELIDTILPEFVESERTAVIEKLKVEIKREYPTVEDDDGVLSFPEAGIDLPMSDWKVNSGNYVIETQLASNDVLEEYVTQLRQQEIAKTTAEATLLTSQSTAIAAGKIVYPISPESVQVNIPAKSE